MNTSIHTGGAAVVDARYCEAGLHSFVAVTADHGFITAKEGGIEVTVRGPVALHVSPDNARQLAGQITAALPKPNAIERVRALGPQPDAETPCPVCEAAPVGVTLRGDDLEFSTSCGCYGSPLVGAIEYERAIRDRFATPAGGYDLGEGMVA